MAKFCTKCGAETVDGKCPKCVEGATATSFDIKESFMDCVKIFKNIFTKPFEAIANFVKENKFVSGIIMIVLTAIATGLYQISSIKNGGASADMSIQDLGNMLSAALGMGSSGPNYFKEFMFEFLRNLCVYTSMVFLGWVIVSKLFKGKTTIKEMVNIVGLSLALVFAANLVNAILVMFDGELVSYIISYVFTFATCMMYLLILGGIEKTSKITKEKLFITVTSIIITAEIVADIIAKIIK